MSYHYSRYPNIQKDYQDNYKDFISKNIYYLKYNKIDDNSLNKIKIKVIGFYVKNGNHMVYATKVINQITKYTNTHYINCQVDSNDYSLTSV